MKTSLHKYSKFVCLAMTLIITVGIFLSAGTNVYASSTNINPKNTANVNLKSKFDPYIHVQNNRYVLELPNFISVNSNEVEQVKESIKYANNQIAINHGIINSDTKIATYQTFSLRSGGSYTYSNFWWGTRYYFRSNNAVYQMDHDLDNYSIMSGVTALWAPAIGALGAAYFQKVKSDLDYYNNTHINDYINMDVNWAGVYSIYSV